LKSDRWELSTGKASFGFFVMSILLFFLNSVSYGQKLQIISRGTDIDSSFYHLGKINANEFWAGGEFGILKRIDSLGNILPLQFPNEGLNILKIERVNNYVYVLTDNSVIYLYNIDTDTFTKKSFPQFHGKCFYDMLPLKNGDLLVCGGTKGISKGEKRIPRGFIARLDPELNTIETVWKSPRKFVWSMAQNAGGEIFAATFNGFNTRIIKSINVNSWTKKYQVSGLVHELTTWNNTLWYSGTQGIRYRKNGILGIAGGKQMVFEKTGCLWSMDEMADRITSVTANGQLLSFDPSTSTSTKFSLPSTFSLYDMEKISSSKILLVGHGKSIYILDFKPPVEAAGN